MVTVVVARRIVVPTPMVVTRRIVIAILLDGKVFLTRAAAGDKSDAAEPTQNRTAIDRDKEDPVLRINHQLDLERHSRRRHGGAGKTARDIVARTEGRNPKTGHGLAVDR